MVDVGDESLQNALVGFTDGDVLLGIGLFIDKCINGRHVHSAKQESVLDADL